ncbi:MAG: Uncharacterized protein FD145_283 [Candidatus Saganbacteria bacterium]|uniref:Uncharacterized protein n=1 Tax=Candidatus Saganbacteria bacterium TaxID=2575572 RepID=A0A833L2C2_UNCSA|nr:MAG: Uncharacterized protein FD145_283 [Candidatus Saganbacteria bacterium]
MLLREKASVALSLIPADLRAKLEEMQKTGTPPSDALIKEIKGHALDGNRFFDADIEPLEPGDLSVLTPYAPTIGDTTWDIDQIIAHDTDELRSLIDEGNSELANNQVDLNTSTAVVGLPAAGVASRAAKWIAESKGHEEIARKIMEMAGSTSTIPPRYLYPIATEYGIETLIGIMLKAGHMIGKNLGASISTLTMLNYLFIDEVIDTLGPELSRLPDFSFENIGLFTQSVSRRLFLTDLQPNNTLNPTGHGDFPNALARFKFYSYLKARGIKYFVFSNADEFLWSPNGLVIGMAKKFISQGYAGIAILVPNTNGQSGGGPVKKKNNPNYHFLCEEPCQAKSQLNKRLVGLNTTFYVMDIDFLLAYETNLQTLSPALDIKTTAGRNGGQEVVIALESWAGSEFSHPHNSNHPLGLRMLFFPRAGVFTGIKSLEQSHSDKIPPEIASTQFEMTYEKYIQHMANKVPVVRKAIIHQDKNVAELLFKNDYSYLI